MTQRLPALLRRPAVAAALSILCSAGAFTTSGCSDTTSAATRVDDSATFAAEPRDLRVTITEKGTLKTANQMLVRAKIPGQAKILTLVDEGTQVAAGDVVCELDKTEVQRQLEDLESRIISVRGDLAAAEGELAIQLSENESDVRDAELKRHFAEIEQERWEKGEFVQEKARREIRVTEAESELARAKHKYEQMPDLEKEGFVTKEQVEEERIRMVKAESELLLGRLDRENYATYTAPKEREQRQADVRNATLEVDRAKQRSTAREAQRRSAVERQKSEMASTEKRLTDARETIANMTIRAPAAGLVIYGDARNPWDERQIKVGETVYNNQAFITLPDLESMLVVVAIHEADISRIKPGQKAFVTVETAREQVIEGKVLRIAPVAAGANNRWSDGVKRFNVDVALEGEIRALKLKPGLTGKVEILVDELKGVLAVPQQAVFSRNGKVHVFKRDGAGATRVPVTIEPGNSQFVVVKDGLAAGDRVLLYDPESAGGAPVAGDAGKSAPKDGAKDAGDAKPRGRGPGSKQP